MARSVLYKKEKSFQIFIDIPKNDPDQRFINFVSEEREETLRDVYDKEKNFILNDHSFAYYHHGFGLDDYEDREVVEANYLPRLGDLIRAKVEDVGKVSPLD